MPRPVKPRRICCLPHNKDFIPVKKNEKETVVMNVDEYETIRLLDYEGLNQEETALQMDIARTTVTSIYSSARKKIADVLVNGKALTIEGGEYRLCTQGNCDNSSRCCRCRCQHHQKEMVK